MQFTDESSDDDGTIVSSSWDFGDGNVSTAQHPVHRYASAGGYLVYLTVTDDRGATARFHKEVYVYSQQPAPPREFLLSVSGRKEKGKWIGSLSWEPVETSSRIDVFRNGILIGTVPNDGSYTIIQILKDQVGWCTRYANRVQIPFQMRCRYPFREVILE